MIGRRTLARTVSGAWAVAAMLAALTGVAPAQDSGAGARAVPSEGLIALIEWDGLDAHEAAWRRTAASRVLNDTTTGAMIESLLGQLFDIVPAEDGEPEVSSAQVVSVVKHVVRKGIVAAVSGDPALGGDPVVTLVIPGAGRGPARTMFESILRGEQQPEAAVPVRGRQITAIPGDPGRIYFAEGEDLVVVLGDQRERVLRGVEAAIAALEGDAPNALDHPIRKELRDAEGGFEPVGLAFLDVKAIPMPPQARQLGLDGVERIDYRWGFEGEALRTVGRVIAPAPRRGVLAALDQPTFGAGSLPPLPPDLRSFGIVSIDLEKVLDVAATVPQVGQSLPGLEQEFERQTGLRLREDVLRAFGPQWAFYVKPQTVTLPTNPWLGFAQYIFHPPKLTAMVQVRDREAFQKDIDALMRAANREMARSIRRGPSPEFVATDDGYVLAMPPEVAPLPEGVRPALVIGDEYAAVGISPEEARAAIEARGLELSNDLGELPGDMIALSLSDPRETVPEVIANLPFFLQLLGKLGEEPGSPPGMRNLARLRIEPELIPDPGAIREHLFPSWVAATVDDRGLTVVSRESIPSINPMSSGPIAVALLLPAVQSAREAARRAQCMNNLKQIGLAMHNYHDANGHLPPAAITDSEGKPLLSWRVAILPYIEQAALYNQFHLDEPWDSPHNRKLAEMVVPAYTCPSEALEPGMTKYRIFAGEGAAFDTEGSVGFGDFFDGTSKTILVVEAEEPVLWTKPEPLEFDPEGNPLDLLGSAHPGGFNALFTDGAVRFLKETINEMVMRALITRKSGEVVGAGQF